MQCVIIAGGKGTRLREALGNLPKPLATVGDRPLLEHQVSLAKKHGFLDILMLTGEGAHYIEEYLGDGSRFGVRISYHRESKPLGTAGAVLDAFDRLQERFVVMYGDTMLNVNLARIMASHPAEADATLFIHPNNHPFDSDLIEVNGESWISAIHPYPHSEGSFFRNLVNAALYVFRKASLMDLYASRERLAYPLDFGKHLFPMLLQQGAKLYGYVSREYICDAGTPQRLAQVRNHYLSGRIAHSSLETPTPAIFLDRDGTLNHERGWLNDPDSVELMPTVQDGVRAINEAGYLAVIITNQPVIARGECSEEGVRRIHDKLEWLLGQGHAFINAIYLCPHHPDGGFAGERPELKCVCACRKPATALFERAAADLNIDLSRSWMIGDRVNDIQAAKALGIRSVLIGSACDVPADGTFDTFLHGVQFALGTSHGSVETGLPIVPGSGSHQVNC